MIKWLACQEDRTSKNVYQGEPWNTRAFLRSLQTFFPTICIFCCAAFDSTFSDKSQLLHLIQKGLHVSSFCFVALKIFSSSLTLLYWPIFLVMMIFKFILSGVHWHSWMSRLIFFMKFGTFLINISSNIFSFFLSFSLLFMKFLFCVCWFLVPVYKSLWTCLFISFLCSPDWIISLELWHLMSFSSVGLNLFLIPSDNFFFSYCTFQLQTYFYLVFIYLFFNFGETPLSYYSLFL